MASRSTPDVAQVSELFVKTRPCRFFLRSQCTKGVACKFAHGQDEKRAKPNLRFTKLCLRAAEGQHCGDLKCRYAHSKAERRVYQAPAHIRKEWQARAVEKMERNSMEAGPAGVGAPSARRQARERRVQKPDISRTQGASKQLVYAPSASLGDRVFDNCNDMISPSVSVLQCVSETRDEESEFEGGHGFSMGSVQVSYQPGGDWEVSDTDDDIKVHLVERNTFLNYESLALATAGTKSEPVHGRRLRSN